MTVFYIHYVTVSQKSSPVLFLWLLGQMLTDFNVWYCCSLENLQPNDVFLSYNPAYIRILQNRKQEIFCMLLMLPLHSIAVVPASSSLLFVQFPQSPTFIRKFCNMFFCSTSFKNVQFLKIKIRSSSLKPMFTPNHWHQTTKQLKQRAFGI